MGSLIFCVTMQVHLQTQQEVVHGFVGTTVHVVRKHGFFSLYNGLSASLSRQVRGILFQFCACHF